MTRAKHLFSFSQKPKFLKNEIDNTHRICFSLVIHFKCIILYVIFDKLFLFVFSLIPKIFVGFQAEFNFDTF